MATTDKSKAPFFPGVKPRVFEQLPAGLDMPTLIRLHDVRGRYRRASFDSDGRPDGKFDESVHSTKHHFSMVDKGFELEELVPYDQEATAAKPLPAPIKW